MKATDLLTRLEGVTGRAGSWTALCPAHEDRTPSLSIADGGDRVLLKCHAGCTTEAVAGALGLKLSDLFLDSVPGTPSREDIVAKYDYMDENGELLFQVVRRFPKEFRQRRPNGRGGWSWSTKGVRRVLYRLPQVLEAVGLGKTVHVVEGEKDVAALERIGAVATTMPGGVGMGWRPEYSDTLRGAHVRIIADRDEPGREHAMVVAAALEGVAAEVELVEAAEGKDAHDHVAAGLGLDDFVPMDSGRGDEEVTEPWRENLLLLADVLRDPSVTAPPEEVIPGFGWRARSTLLVSREKTGKTTLTASLAATKSRGGRFLDKHVDRGPVLVLYLEDHPHDVARYLTRFGADPDNVWLTRHLDNGFADLRAMIDSVGAQLVIIDTLEEFVARGLGVETAQGDDPAWTGVMSDLRTVARETDAALIITHHANKSDGKSRGSTRIAAGVDAVVTMSVTEDGVRRFDSVARWPTDSCSLHLREADGDAPDFYERTGLSLSLDARIISFVETNPGCTKRDIRTGVSGSSTALDRTLTALLNAGEIENRGLGQGHAYYRAGHGSGTVRGTVEMFDSQGVEAA